MGILVKTAPSPLSVKTVPAVIQSPGAVAVRLGSAGTCARMVSLSPFCPRQKYLFLNHQWKHFFPTTGGSYLKFTMSCFLCAAGCPKGFYGKQCNKKCNCANNGRCHRTYGACLCDAGLYGRFCHLRKSLCPNITRVSPLNSNVRNPRL